MEIILKNFFPGWNVSHYIAKFISFIKWPSYIPNLAITLLNMLFIKIWNILQNCYYLNWYYFICLFSFQQYLNIKINKLKHLIVLKKVIFQYAKIWILTQAIILKMESLKLNQ